jgi:hypothetical protein
MSLSENTVIFKTVLLLRRGSELKSQWRLTQNRHFVWTLPRFNRWYYNTHIIGGRHCDYHCSAVLSENYCLLGGCAVYLVGIDQHFRCVSWFHHQDGVSRLNYSRALCLAFFTEKGRKKEMNDVFAPISRKHPSFRQYVVWCNVLVETVFVIRAATTVRC